VLKVYSIILGGMEAWRSRFKESRERFLEDDEDDDANMEMAVDQFQNFIDYEAPSRRAAGGSRQGRAANIERDRVIMDAQMHKDYFADRPTYGPHIFRRRYRMRRSLFCYILERVCARDVYFVQKRDAAGLLGLSSRQKITAALRMLALGVCADAMDDYCRTSDSTAMECMGRFCAAVRAEFGDYYLRKPTYEDCREQLAINEARGFPGMFGSLDCMHYEWKNCPVAWQGDFGDRDGKKSIILEAVADQSLHIWHIYFGLPGSNNDLNVLDRSPLIHDLLSGAACDMTFEVNGQVYNRYYLLADGIYPQWSCFVQSIHNPEDEKRKHFAKRQEACRKDVERCFGVLQARFAIIRNPCRQWGMQGISNIMFACCILHNMIIDDESGVQGLENVLGAAFDDNVPMERGLTFEQLLEHTQEIEDEDIHYSLRGDLIEHLWTLKGQNMYEDN
jgi:hypothetical protein